jgi:N-acetylglucosaminyl-diphospho-decaprenol L-rhamnosyltransferase
VANATNRGLAAANNQGILLSRGSTVVISNPDVVFAPTAIDELVEELGRRPRAAFVVPQVQLPDGGLQSVAGDLPTLSEALLGRVVAHLRSRGDVRRGFCWDGWRHDEEARVGRAGDVCYAARREAIAQIGLQDERFPLDWEGIDWSARGADVGWEVWFTPRARVTHLLGGSTRKAPGVRRVVTAHRGMYRYFRNRMPVSARPVLAAAFALRAVVKTAVVLLRVPVHEWSYRAQRVHDGTVASSEST